VSQVQSDKKDRSLVTVNVPKRLRGKFGNETLVWREFKLRTRLMPNGYRVTIAGICHRGRLFFAASACAPDDLFDRALAHSIALGRARQAAFRCPSLYSLLCDENHENRSPLDSSYSNSYHGPDEDHAVFEAIKANAVWLYPIAARNAEMKSLRVSLADLRRRYGKRFYIKAEFAK